MATIGFDTYKAVKALTDAGFSESQAETVVSTVSNALAGDVATKTDLKDLELRLTLRLGGMMIAVGGLVVALIKLLP